MSILSKTINTSVIGIIPFYTVVQNAQNLYSKSERIYISFIGFNMFIGLRKVLQGFRGCILFFLGLIKYSTKPKAL